LYNGFAVALAGPQPGSAPDPILPKLPTIKEACSEDEHYTCQDFDIGEMTNVYQK